MTDTRNVDQLLDELRVLASELKHGSGMYGALNDRARGIEDGKGEAAEQLRRVVARWSL